MKRNRKGIEKEKDTEREQERKKKERRMILKGKKKGKKKEKMRIISSLSIFERYFFRFFIIVMNDFVFPRNLQNPKWAQIYLYIPTFTHKVNCLDLFSQLQRKGGRKRRRKECVMLTLKSGRACLYEKKKHSKSPFLRARTPTNLFQSLGYKQLIDLLVGVFV